MTKTIKKVSAMLLSLLLLLSVIPANLIVSAASDCILYASFLDSETNKPISGLEFELYDSSDAKVATGITTDESDLNIGNLRISDLNEGVYYLRLVSKSHFIADSDVQEEYDDEGGFMFLLSAGESTFIKGDNYKLLTQIKGNVLLTKTINGTSVLPKNVVFDLYKKETAGDTKVGTYSTGETNKISIDNLPYGQYYFVETSAPAPIVINSTPIDFEIKNNNETINLTFANDFKCSVKLIKCDTNNAESKLQGVEFDLYDNSANTPKLVDSYTTDSNGEINLELPVGSYYFVETKTLQNYELNTEKHYFELSFENYEKTINVSNTKYPEVTIKKIDNNNNYVSGATLAIYKDSTLIKEFVTNDTDYTILLEPGKYTLKEIVTPNGYAEIEDIEFVVNSNENKTVTVYNNKINIGISKYKLGTTEYLPGAKLSLLDESKNIVCQWTSDEKEYIIDSINAGIYYIHEDSAPTGYKKTKDVKIEVKPVSEKQSFSIYNELVIRNINIRKIDSLSNLALSNAKFELYNSNNQKIDEWTSSSDYKLLQLKVGTYILKETIVPNGYVADGKDTIITVYSDETVVIEHDLETSLYKADDAIYYDIENDPIRIKIYKTDKDTNVKLNNANLTLSNDSGYNSNFLSNENGTLFTGIPSGTYTITENDAPNGYKITTSKTIEVKATAEIQEFYIEDEMLLGQITVTKTGDILKDIFIINKFENYITNSFNWIIGNLQNVTFELYAKENIIHPDGKSNNIYTKDELIKTAITGLDGTVIFDNLPIGSYYIKETQTQLGYVFNENPIYFDIVEIAGKLEPVAKTVNNEYKTVSIKLNKTDTDNNSVEGAIYGIYSSQDIYNASLEKVLDKDTLIDVEKTNTLGELEFDIKLPKGEYYIKEIEAPKGYVLSNNVFKIDLTESNSSFKNNDDATVNFSFNDIDEYIKISISKIDSENNLNVSGSTLQLIDKATGTISAEWTSSAEAKVFRKIPKGIYIIKETVASNGYTLNTVEKEITVESKSDLQKFNYTNKRVSGSIEIIKVENNTSKLPVQGVKFKVYNDNINFSQIVTTDENGKCLIEDLPVGIYENNIYKNKIEYKIEEISAPEGYLINQDIETIAFDLLDTSTDKSIEKSIVIKNDYTHLVVNKIEANSKENVVGAKLDIYNASYVDENLNPIKDAKPLYSFVSSNEPYDISIEKIPVGEYVLIENEAPDGYITAVPIKFEVKAIKDLQIVEMTDDYTKLEIYKKDKTTNENIVGANLKLEDANGNTVAEWLSTTEAKVFTKLPIGKYTLIEVSAPNGYRPTENIEFEIKETADIQTVEMFDEADVYDFNISKIDYDTGNMISGANLELYNDKQELIDEWISTEESHVVKNLTPGYYYIHETVAPYGYCKSEDMGFEVKANDITQDTNVLFENKYIIVDIVKLDSDTNKPVIGAKLHIEDEDGNILDNWTSTKEAHRITKLQPGTYFIVEDEAPQGYEINTECVEFTVKETSKIQKVKVYNNKVIQTEEPRSPINGDVSPIYPYILFTLIIIAIIGIVISKKHLK